MPCVAAKALERLGAKAAAISAWKKVIDREFFGYEVNEAAEAFERLGDSEAAVLAWSKWVAAPFSFMFY